MSPEELNNLREAIKASPENITIRKFLISQLIKTERWEEAEVEIKEAMQLAPQDVQLKIDLANTFGKLRKITAGLVLMEEILRMERPPAKAFLTHAKLLLQNKEAADAKDAYEKAILINPDLIDNFLESEINMQLQSDEPDELERIKLTADGIEGDDDEDESFVDIERPKISFKDVGGMEKLKEEINLKIIAPLQHQDLYKAYGKKIGGGILMYGPPGCGKTHLARATAGEINANFIPVGLSDILDMYVGQSERNLHAIFERARRLKPCVLFFDEVDALGANRSDMKNSASRHVINQFLEELDGVQYDNEGVLVLAATNAPWHLDPAFRRPGRFDRIIFVPPPDDTAKAAILELKTKDKPFEQLDFSKLAKRAKNYSGADIEAIIDIAIEGKLLESMKLGKPVPVQSRDVEKAMKQHKASTREWFTTAKNYALFANESGLYDDILDYLKKM